MPRGAISRWQGRKCVLDGWKRTAEIAQWRGKLKLKTLYRGYVLFWYNVAVASVFVFSLV
uniref:Uncharacterized protein n=1 Tax=Solanum tuberosum TaxID=4113 RepID=M1A1Q7_SOLTU